MSKYTTELRWICEHFANLGENASVIDIIKEAAPQIFNFDYPIYNPSHKLDLEITILRHFYTREICEETYGLWHLRLEDTIRNIMPYYNELYKSVDLEYNPLQDTDVKTTHNQTGATNSVMQQTANDHRDTKYSETENLNTKAVDDISNQSITDDSNNTSASRTSTSNSDTDATTNANAQNESNETVQKIIKDAYSETPQGTLSDVEDNTYLTNARITNNDDTATKTDSGTTASISHQETKNSEEYSENSDVTGKTQTDFSGKTTTNTDSNNARSSETVEENTNEVSKNDNVNTTTNYITSVIGKTGAQSYAQMVLDFRAAIINVDLLILNELECLFLELW